MKFMLVIFVATFALVRADDTCSEEKVLACVDALLESVMGDTTEDEVCKGLTTSVDCLRNAVDECYGEEHDEDVEEGLRELENLLKENCAETQESENSESDADDEEMAKCFEENEDYIYECIYQSSTEALNVLVNKSDIDENVLKCALYGLMAGCFVERIEEKCGAEAAQLAAKELSDLPQEVEEACEAAGNIETHEFQLLDKKK